VIVCVVDIDEIVDNHCLKSLYHLMFFFYLLVISYYRK